MKKNFRRYKIIVAMSGGVDSAVAAALLKKEGHDVIGVFMLFWSEDVLLSHVDNFTNRCCSLEAQETARATAKQIGIPFYTMNVRDEFKKEVVDHFLSEFKAGHTPNPCIVCNKEIKFKVLIKKALEMKADFIATGHYARIKSKVNHKGLMRSKTFKHKEYHLLRAKDRTKDQSYFLYNLNQEQLSRIIFPIGDYKKTETRKIAKKMKLAVYDREESQEICFIVDNDIRAFLRRNLDLRKGDIINSRGEKIGEHEGTSLYTIGQRHGIGIGGGKPYYVAGAKMDKNILLVTDDPNDPLLWKRSLTAKEVNWISGYEPKLPAAIEASVRYRHTAAKAMISKISDNEYSVSFQKPERAITPGQSVVFYKDEEVLGGGMIVANGN